MTSQVAGLFFPSLPRKLSQFAQVRSLVKPIRLALSTPARYFQHREERELVCLQLGH